MPRPFTRAQCLENRAFLKALARTGNAREAARLLGAHRAKFTRRRAKHPAFAAEWDAALALAHAALHDRLRGGEGEHAARGGGGPPPSPRSFGDPQLHRTPSGRLQLRRPGGRRRLTRAAEQAFLAALSATANVRLSAAAAGFSHSAFYARRKSSPAFAREMRLALQIGYERIEGALIEGWMPEAQQDDAWRHNDPPPIPAMTPNQALQLLHLHQKEARLRIARPDMKARRGETTDTWSARRAAAYRAELAARTEDALVRKVLASEPRRAARDGKDAPILPALDQVTGWSKARPDKPPHHEDVALFGGWRIEDWQER
ncbi:hypothetical protein [Hephaestia mangrovi]|uniref:hypothetical protein n=1 Tax=Hephaestia mangrovi TaxID=2873268 RepID=UPI001CA7B67C|nr:hypothetical protein [Hephaestia mangrovi]MBY8827413.1 hypothetical protein [Hephaestia mangrovi]